MLCLIDHCVTHALSCFVCDSLITGKLCPMRREQCISILSGKRYVVQDVLFFFIKRHSVYPPVSMVVSKKNPKLVCAIFMVKNGKNLFQSNGLELTGVTVMNGILVHCKYIMKAAHPSQHLSGFQRQLSPVPISSSG